MTNRFTPHRIALGALTGAVSAIIAAAAPLTPASAQSYTSVTLPTEVQAGAARYTTGGVTQDESDLFKARARDYPLAIELVQKPDFGPRDQYTANARVVIRNQGGQEILNAQAEGPFMLVRLEPGTYEIAATLGERTLSKQHVIVRDGQSTHTVFVFPAGTG